MTDFVQLNNDLKKRPCLLRGLRLDRALCLDICNWTRDGMRPKPARRYLVKQLFLFALRPTRFSVDDDAPVLFFDCLSYPRHDYSELIKKYCGQSADTSIVHHHTVNTPNPVEVVRRVMSLIALTRILFAYRKNINSLVPAVPLSPLMILGIRLLHFTLAAEHFLATTQPRAVAVICDVHPAENMIVQMAQKSSIRTICLQHAAYPDFEHTDMSVLTLCATQADIHIAWGGFSARLLKRYNPRSEVLVGGNPLLSQSDANKTLNNATIIVYFDNFLYADSNQRLLDVLNKFDRSDFEIIYRFHPHDRIDRYSFLHTERLDNDSNNDGRIVIGHNTTMILREAIAGKTVLRFSDARNANYGVSFPLFETTDQLAGLMATAPAIERKELQQFIDNNRTMADCLGELKLTE